MDPFPWFRKRIGKRVHLEIEGVAPQSWRIYLAGTEVAVLVLPSKTKRLDQLMVFYSGIRRFADLSGGGGSGDVVGSVWDPLARRWRPLTRKEALGSRSRLSGDPPPVPDHLPDDIS